MASWASAEPRLGPLRDPKSELSPRRNASFCFGCVFSCALVLAALGLLLGLLLACFWAPKWGPDGTRSRPRSVLKMEPKNDLKRAPKWDPKTEVNIKKIWQKRATGATEFLSPLSLGGALPRSWVFFAPKMAQEPLFDLNLRQMWALNWPKSQIFTPTSFQGVGASERYLIS